MVARQYEEIRAHEPGGDADDVHKLRVAMRRLRAMLRAARPVLDGEWAEGLRGELRGFASALGPVRDLDVLIAHVAQDPDDGGIVEALRERRDAALAGAQAAFSGLPYRHLLERLDDAAAEPRLVRDADLRKEAAKEFRKLVRERKRAGADPDDEALHRLRIRTKRARYAAELVEPAVGPRAAKFTVAAKGLQDVLGEHQDAVVAEDVLRRLGAQAHTDGENGFALGVLYAQGEARKALLDEQLPELWQRVWTRKTTAWMR
jgi:CHAD domain-containing protein